MVSIMDVSSPLWLCLWAAPKAFWIFILIHLASVCFSTICSSSVVLTSAASQKDGSACLGLLDLDSLEQDQEVAGVWIQHPN